MAVESDLVTLTPHGLWCEAGGFHIDPWRPVDRAVITHGHADHARAGSTRYLCSAPCRGVLAHRLSGSSIQGVAWGERLGVGDVTLSFHPAGHVLGAAQVRIEHRGRVWVVSGDYRVEPDTSCTPFESVGCDVFVTESTFGLPIYRWQPQAQIMAEIHRWWQENAAQGRPSVLYAYSLGKAQRILAALETGIGPVHCHGAIDAMNQVYRAEGVALPDTLAWPDSSGMRALRGALLLAPPALADGRALARLREPSEAVASGWMRVRAARRRRAVDRGFALSDHADWPGLLQAIRASGAQRVIVTHGFEAALVRWLGEQGLQAGAFATEFGDDTEDDADAHRGSAAGVSP